MLVGLPEAMERISTVIELGSFLRDRKKYWLGPIFILLGLFGLLIVFGESSGLGPFVYPFF